MNTRLLVSILASVAIAACGTDDEAGRASRGGELAAGQCVGVAPTVTYDQAVAGELSECPTCVGAPMPDFALEDFQTSSCGAGQVYGLSEFRGAPTMVVLLSAGCSYCLGQTVDLEQMWWELDAAGHEFHFVVINLKSMVEQQQNLLDRATFPMLQDVDAVDAWSLMGGGKDDFYFYDADGRLAAWWPAAGAIETTLSDADGYANVRDAMLHLLGEDVALPTAGDGE